MKTIHFICRGNANRSLIAEAYLKSLNLPNIAVMSSGSGADTYRKENIPRIPHIKAILDKYRVGKYAKNSPEQLTQARAELGDVTVCMNQRVYNESCTIVQMPTSTIVWNVDDVGEGHRLLQPKDDPYKYTEETFQQIASEVDRLVKDLQFTTHQVPAI